LWELKWPPLPPLDFGALQLMVDLGWHAKIIVMVVSLQNA